MTAERLPDDERIERYLRGLMSDDELTDFEEYFLDKPELIEQIELGQLLISGLRESRAPTTADAVPEKPAWWTRLFGSGPGPAWAVACVLLLLVFLPRELQHQDRMAALNSPQANTPSLVLGAVRGDLPGAELNLVSGTIWFSLELELDWPEHDRYSLDILRDGQPNSVLEVQDLVPSASDTLVVTLPADRFRSGDYELRVVADRTEVARYRMRVSVAVK